MLTLTELRAAEDRWYAERNCWHAHCPEDCEHPQPFLTSDGRLLCGRCWVMEQRVSEMIPCTPDACETEHSRP
jgi:hypothetical protein